THALDVREPVVARLLIVHAEHDHVARSIALVDAHERGILLGARQTPRREEIHDHDLAREIREGDGSRSVETLEGEARRLLADRAGTDVVRIAAERERERHDETEDRDDDGDTDDPGEHHFADTAASATGIRTARRRGAGSAAMSAPNPTTAPPSQSHETPGITRIRIVAQENVRWS